MQISNAQSRAIAHGKGPAMVLAGPGSGKTLVITQRTKYLIEKHRVSPREILVITFTRAAAQEMQNRFAKISGAKGVIFGTFHAVFFSILKAAYRFTSANILSEEKKYQILQQLLREYRLNPAEEKELLPELAAEISLVKNEQIDLLIIIRDRVRRKGFGCCSHVMSRRTKRWACWILMICSCVRMNF